jgi:hypothetical protein
LCDKGRLHNGQDWIIQPSEQQAQIDDAALFMRIALCDQMRQANANCSLPHDAYIDASIICVHRRSLA